MNIGSHKIDTALADQGVWLEYDDAKFLIASRSSARFTRASMKAFKKLSAHQLTAKPELALEINQKLLAENCLLGWKNLKTGPIGKEKAVPYSAATALDIIRSAPDFGSWVAEQAGTLANFQAEALAEDADALKSSGDVAAPELGEPELSGEESGEDGDDT